MTLLLGPHEERLLTDMLCLHREIRSADRYVRGDGTIELIFKTTRRKAWISVKFIEQLTGEPMRDN